MGYISAGIHKMINYPKNPDEIAKLLNEESTPDPSKMSPWKIYCYALRSGRRWPEAEYRICRTQATAYYYALRVMGARWPEAERYIMKSPKWACYYAYYLVRGRWPEAERYIMKDPKWAYYYAHDVLKARWPEYEAHMAGVGVSDNLNPMDDHEDSVRGNWWEEYQREFMK